MKVMVVLECKYYSKLLRQI